MKIQGGAPPLRLFLPPAADAHAIGTEKDNKDWIGIFWKLYIGAGAAGMHSALSGEEMETFVLTTSDRPISAHQHFRLIFDLLKIGQYVNSNYTMIRDARYYRPTDY